MTDADLPDGPDAAPPGALPQPALAYDYFKSMASVSVATLGGILTLSETVFGARIEPWQMGVSALLVAASGLLALQAKTDIMQLCQGMKPPMNSARLALRMVPSLYGLGLGLFVGVLTLSYLSAPSRPRETGAADGKPIESPRASVPARQR